MTEAVAVVGTAVTVPLYLSDLQSRTDAYSMGNDFEAQEYIDRAWTVRSTNLVFVGAFAAISVAGVLEAEANYVPTVVEVKRRAIPTLSFSPAPLVAPTADGRGMTVGVVGRF